ncbi:hypothetical protein [Candidatus Magnetaquicoccus inordinatus]|uniref:hypothetical protein n=1 Tax=Candidatus Magnetaquicoccus inordinatus TaxID=2496818 RepID=UPI00102C90E5|nr:hypothetical protein [Candidatus Magnetaquicoccus inordinatus]
MNDYKVDFDRLFFDTLKIPYNAYCKRCSVPTKTPIAPYVGLGYWHANPRVLFVGSSHFTNKMSLNYMLHDLDAQTAFFIDGCIENLFDNPQFDSIAYATLIPCPFPSKSIKDSILDNCANGLNTLFHIIKTLQPDNVIFFISRNQYNAVHDLSLLTKSGTSVEEITKIDSEIEQDGYSAPFWSRRIEADYGNVNVLVLNRNVTYDKFYSRIIESGPIESRENSKTIIGSILSSIWKR